MLRANPPMPRSIPEPDKDWEDVWRRERHQHDELKVLYNEQEDHMRKLRTRIQKLEADVTKLDMTNQQLAGIIVNGGVRAMVEQMEAVVASGGIGKPGSAGGNYMPRNKEEENMIGSLSDQVSKLKRQNNGLLEKNKQLAEQLERKKRELLSAKRPTAQAQLVQTKRGIGMAGTTKENNPPPPPEIDIRPGATHLRQTQRPMAFDSPAPLGNVTSFAQTPAATAAATAAATDSNLLEVARKYKARLTAAEEQLAQVRNATIGAGRYGRTRVSVLLLLAFGSTCLPCLLCPVYRICLAAARGERTSTRPASADVGGCLEDPCPGQPGGRGAAP